MEAYKTTDYQNRIADESIEIRNGWTTQNIQNRVRSYQFVWEGKHDESRVEVDASMSRV